MFNLRHQAVRDLAWCCFSAPLLKELPETEERKNIEIWPALSASGTAPNAVDSDLEWLRQLDENPRLLLNELAQVKSTRLGIYYETLWRFYWQQHPQWQLLAHNLQVVNNGQTLGAFDFILQKDQQYWHLETAVKFYLGIPGPGLAASEWSHWIGPNCSDRLDIKLKRLLHHQLPLSSNPLGQQKLKLLTPSFTQWRSAMCLQGYLFYPARQLMAEPIAGHPRHGRGLWWHMQDFFQDLRKGEIHSDYWIILARHQWLAPGQTTDINDLLRGESLIRAIEHWVGETQRPQLVAAVVKINGIWQEKMRGFVVPDHWPRIERPLRNT